MTEMRSAIAIRKEHRAICAKIKELEKEGGGHQPLDKHEGLYFRLHTMKNTLEWVLPVLIRTPRVEDVDRRAQLMGYRHYVYGPLHALLYP
jgi:hypothetical protein